MGPTLVLEQSFPPTWECDGWHPCIHLSKWRLSGLRCSHGWVKVYLSPWQPFTSTLHWSPPWSMSRTLLDCLQERVAVCRKTGRCSRPVVDLPSVLRSAVVDPGSLPSCIIRSPLVLFVILRWSVFHCNCPFIIVIYYIIILLRSQAPCVLLWGPVLASSNTCFIL